jgi:hypothetical protein
VKTVRLQIVEAMGTALATATGLTVHRNLDYALEDTNLPVLLVQSGEDAPLEAQTQNQVLDQSMTVEITVLAAPSADPEGAADSKEAAVHAALMAATAFGGQPVIVERLGGSWAFDLGDITARSLRYRIGYRTRWADLTTA